MKNRSRLSTGFTLLEMLVVLAIIGVLAALVGPKIFGVTEDANRKAAEAQVKTLRTAVEAFRLSVGRYPTAQEGLVVISKAPTDPAIAARWRGPYIDSELPLDPWNMPYQYSLPGANGQPFALYSFGYDKQRGGEGDNADIGILPPS